MRYIYFIYILFFIQTNLLAQDTLVEFWRANEYTKDADGFGTISPYLKTDKFSNTYTVFVQTDETPLMGINLIKYDSIGNQVWKYTSPSNWEHYPSCFTVDSLGYSYVGFKYFFPFHPVTPTLNGTSKLLKFSPDGALLWGKKYIFSTWEDRDVLSKSQMDTINGRLIVFGGHSHPDSTEQNYHFVQAVDTSSGETIWKTIVKDVPVYLYNMRVLEDKIMVFYARSKPDGLYYAVVHFDLDGHIIGDYEHRYPDDLFSYNDYSYISENGNIILGTRWGGYDVTKLNPQGDTVWSYTHTLGGVNVNGRSWAINEDYLQNVYSSGGTISTLGDTARDILTTKFDPQGNIIWQDAFQLLPKPEYDVPDMASFIAVDKNYVAILGGSSIGNGKGRAVVLLYKLEGDKPEYEFVFNDTIPIGARNISIIEDKLLLQFTWDTATTPMTDRGHVMTVCLSIPEISGLATIESDNQVNTFPNPTSGTVHLNGLDTQYLDRLCIMDMSGKILETIPIAAESMSFRMDGYPPGTYILSLQGKQVTINKKVMKH